MTLNCPTLLLLLGAVHLGNGHAGAKSHQQTMVSAETLDQLRGTPPEARAAYLSAAGLSRDDWYPRFERAAGDVLTYTQGGARAAPGTFGELHAGMILVSLLCEKQAAPTLKRIVQSIRAVEGEAIVYQALITLNELATEDAFLIARIGDPDPHMAKLAILAAALRSDEAIVAELELVLKTRIDEAPIQSAFNFVKFLREGIAHCNELSTPEDRLHFVGQQVARGHNPISGVPAHGDLHSAGGPLTRWAFERWRELASQFPDQTLAFIRNQSPYETVDLNDSYRRYLARHGSAAVLARLGDGK